MCDALHTVHVQPANSKRDVPMLHQPPHSRFQVAISQVSEVVWPANHPCDDRTINLTIEPIVT
jgi:hypothetical protein